MQGSDSTQDLLPVGTIVDNRYRITRFLGRGGFAVVYEAIHTTLERPAALKILDLYGNSQDIAIFRERFAREAKLAAKIEHPNVVKIMDFGFVEQRQQPYIAMELLRGHDLEQELTQNGPMHPERALGLFDGALDALGLAHQHNIVHKDLKPSNLFIVDPNTPREKLIVVDFGIAGIFGDSDGRLTKTSQYTGTPAYAAPEYIQEQQVSPALDVYQMGLILTETLSGTPAVQASTPMACFMVHVGGQHNVDDRIKSSPLWRVLEGALAPDPRQRPQNARALQQALRQIDPVSVPNLGHAPSRSMRDSNLNMPAAAPQTGGDWSRPTAASAPVMASPRPAATLENATAPLARPPHHDKPTLPSSRPNAPGPRKKKASPLILFMIVSGIFAAFVSLLLGAFLLFLIADEDIEAPNEVHTSELSVDLELGDNGQPPTLDTSATDGVMGARGDFKKLHAAHLSLQFMLGIDQLANVYLIQRERFPDNNEIAESSAPRGLLQLFSQSSGQLDKASSTPPNDAALDQKLEDYAERSEAFEEIFSALEDYWKIEEGWREDDGARGEQLDARLSALMPEYTKSRDALIDALVARNKKALARYKDTLDPRKDLLDYHVTETLEVMQTAQIAMLDDMASGQTKEALEALEASVKATSKQAKKRPAKGIMPGPHTNLDHIKNYLIQARDAHREARKPKKKKLDERLAASSRAMTVNSNYFMTMSTYYQLSMSAEQLELLGK